MREAANDWLDLATLDLRASRRILDDPDLIPVVLFHAQQAVEKLFKALLEERGLTVPKSHDLERLYGLVLPHFRISVDEDALRLLSSLYISTRYPAGMGLLPCGLPSQAEGERLVSFAEALDSLVRGLLREA